MKIVICCDQIDCKSNSGRFVDQAPSHINMFMFTNVCLHEHPDIREKNESSNKTISDGDAIRKLCLDLTLDKTKNETER